MFDLQSQGLRFEPPGNRQNRDKMLSLPVSFGDSLVTQRIGGEGINDPLCKHKEVTGSGPQTSEAIFWSEVDPG